jgi:hypothetical protein
MQKPTLLHQLEMQRALHFNLISKWEYHFHENLKSFYRFSIKQCDIAISIYNKLLDKRNNKCFPCLVMTIKESKNFYFYDPLRPKGMSAEEYLEERIESHTNWILEKIKELEDVKASLIEKEKEKENLVTTTT